MNSLSPANSPAEEARLSLGMRLGIIAAILIAEKSLLNRFADFELAASATGFGAMLRISQHWLLRFLVALAGALVLFSLVRSNERLSAAAQNIRHTELKARWLVLNAALLVCLIPVTVLLFRADSRALPLEFTSLLWLVLAGLATLSLVRGMAPWPLWAALVRALGAIWYYALPAALFATAAVAASQLLWHPTAGLTFRLVTLLLGPILPHLTANPATRELSTGNFTIEVSDECSGLEGIGLILVFLTAWLAYFRREFIFPRALSLIPLGLIAIFALNVLRISVLMVICAAGRPDVAMLGFHSQAGWMAFNLVAVGLALWSRRSRWLNREVSAASGGLSATDTRNPTAAYLLPLLVIIAAGVVSHAMSAGFETFYPLRLAAALLALFLLRGELTRIPVRFSFRAPLWGIAVFALWIAGAMWLLPPQAMPAELAQMGAVPRLGWVIARVLGSVVTVPIAEELAYRGFLMRRLQRPDFESLPYERVGAMPLIISSLIFGMAHGALWLPGILAGLAYGWLTVWRRSLGEAIVAHATTNALVALAVLAAGRWELW